MDITLNHLKTRWNRNRINKIKNFGFVICDQFNFYNFNNLDMIDACICKNFKETVKTRNKWKRAKHIFISEWCKLAIDEYQQVLKILKPKSVIYICTKTLNRLPIIK